MIESYLPQRVVKDIAPGARKGGLREYQPGYVLDALNCRYRSQGASGALRNVPGTLIRNVGLPAGTNTCIGKFLYSKYNSLVYMLHNSNMDHRIIEWSSDTDTITTLMQGSSLGFTLDHYISQGGIIDDNLTWNDGNLSPRSINIVFAKQGLYTAPYSEYEISLAARPPDVPAIFAPGIDGAILVNSVVGHHFQFSYQFIYKDNRRSTFCSPSALAWTELYGKPDSVNNIFNITVYFPPELLGIVKRIDVCFKEGNSGNYFIFESVKNPTLSEYTVKFTNSGRSEPVAVLDQSRISDYIPSRTDALEVIENRIFAPLNKSGFDIDDSTFNLTVELVQESVTMPYNTTNRHYLKQGGIYNVGVIFEDGYGRTSFVKSVKTVSVPFDMIGNFGTRTHLKWTITGTPPAGVVKYRIVISKNQQQSSYFQCKAVPHFYISELPATFTDNSTNSTFGLYAIGGKLFKNVTPSFSVPGDPSLFPVKAIYLQIPLNSPVVPDPSYLVKLPDGLPVKYSPIIDIVGDYIVIPYFEFDWNTYLSEISDFPESIFTEKDNKFYVEVFKKRDTEDQLYYEIPKTYQIVANDFSVFSQEEFYGDTFNVQFGQGINPGHEYTQYFFWAAQLNIVQIYMIRDSDENSYIETPSAVLASVSVQNVTQTTINPGESGGNIIVSGTVKKNVFSFDYNKISDDFGRAHTVYDDEKEQNFFSTVGFSDPYVQGSQINGLNTFRAANQYPLAIERGPIRGLVRSGKILLAIHETITSSLYINDGFVRQGNDFILTKTDEVVGDDRALEYGYGTINPESIIKAFNLVFFYDAHKGAIVQYSQAGLENVAKYGMQSYFYQKALDYFPYRNSVKIVTGFDFTTNELLITFPDVRNEAMTIIIAAETWAFNIQTNEWTTRYSFIGEQYVSIGLKLISWKAGQIWRHNVATVFNNFYGVQYSRKWRFVMNNEANKNKRPLNYHVHGSLCRTPTSTSFMPLRIYTQEGQESYTPACYFDLDERMWSGPVLQDIHTPGDFTDRLPFLSGDDLNSEYFEVQVENDALDQALVTAVNVVFKEEEFSI